MKSGLWLRNILICVIITFLFQPLTAQIYTDVDDLNDDLKTASPGDIFIVKKGSYKDFEVRVESSGEENQPIVIMAEKIGEVTLNGESSIVLKKSAHIIIKGFVFDCQDAGTLVKLEGCNNIRITQNVFEQTSENSAKWVYVGGYWNDNSFDYTSHHNRIDHNIFQNKDHLGHYITIDGSNDGDEDYRQSQYDRIDHNYFVNNGPRATNEQESIRIGWSEMSMSSGYTLVEHNLFESCDGDPEIVSVKSCDNIIRHNTFRGSYGTLSLRHGNRNRVESNFFLGNNRPVSSIVLDGETMNLYTGGIRIYGTDHVIVNNYFEGLNGTRWDAPITLTNGDAIDGSSTSWSKHFRPERIIIAYNTLVNNDYGIELGFDNNNKYGKKIEDITLINNLVIGTKNNLINYIDNNSTGTMQWANNLFFPMNWASLTNNETTFLASEIEIKNPYLQESDPIWRATQQTAKKVSGVSTIGVPKDIDGQDRPTISSVGADHFTQEDVYYHPLLPENVGPNAKDLTVSLSKSLEAPGIIVYPNPTNEKLQISNLPLNTNKILLFDARGQLCYSHSVTDCKKITINISAFTNGLYTLEVFGEQKHFKKRISILK